MVFHSFSFDTLEDSPDIQVLDYRYGANNKEYEGAGQIGVHADKYQLSRGQTFASGGATGVIPRGDFLYVKWRSKETGKIYEDHVDLTKRLPADIQYCAIHFAIKEAQLYIYLIPPPGTWPVGAIQKSAIDKSWAIYLQQHQIYPDVSK